MPLTAVIFAKHGRLTVSTVLHYKKLCDLRASMSDDGLVIFGFAKITFSLTEQTVW